MDTEKVKDIEKFFSKKHKRSLDIYEIMTNCCPDDYDENANCPCDNLGTFGTELCESCWKDVIGDIE